MLKTGLFTVGVASCVWACAGPGEPARPGPTPLASLPSRAAESRPPHAVADTPASVGLPSGPTPPPPKPPPDPHVHPPVTSDGRGIDEELQPVTAKLPACKGACKGTLGSELQAALVAIARRGRHCYAVATLGDPSLAGTLSVEVKVAPSGDICSARVHAGTLKSRAVTGCLEKLFREQHGLPGADGCVQVKIPMRFDSPEASPDAPSER